MATNRIIIYMLKRNKVCCSAVISVMLFDYYSGITLRNTNLSTSNTQAPMPRLIIGYQEIPQLFSQVVSLVAPDPKKGSGESQYNFLTHCYVIYVRNFISIFKMAFDIARSLLCYSLIPCSKRAT